jgi:hypothetical protein
MSRPQMAALGCVALAVAWLALDDAELRREKRILLRESAETQSALFKLHNMYASHMHSLVPLVNNIRDDSGARRAYDPDVSARAKLAVLRDVVHRRNRSCRKILDDVCEYLVYGRDSIARTDDERRFYARLLCDGGDGRVVLDLQPVPDLDPSDIERCNTEGGPDAEGMSVF